MKLSDIKPGMTIEYRGRAYGHRNLIGKQETRTGTVTQVTPNLIAVQGQRYPDTILVNDLLSGQVKIISLKEEEHMSNPVGKPKREPPAKEKLQQAFEKHEGKIKPIATEFKTGWAQARNWLIEAGIIDSDYVYQKQTPTLEPEQAANQEPERETAEPAEDIIPKTEMGCPFDEEAFNPDIPEVVEDAFPASAFTIVDEEEPFPYTVTEEKAFNLDTFKMRVLEIFQEVARANQAPAYVSLAFMNAIIDTYPEKGE